jgi:spore coat protein CotF
MELKDYLGDILETEKNMVVNYAHALNEASCDNLYKEFKRQFDNISNYTKTLFNIAYNNGFYNLEQVQSNKIKQEYSKLSDDLSCLDNE